VRYQSEIVEGLATELSVLRTRSAIIPR
jgi:hypothetical protein